MSRTAEATRPKFYRFSWPTYAALLSLTFLVNYPGRLDSDTLDMVTMGEYPAFLYDWHAPVLTWLYSIFAPALGQPAGALFMQALLLFVYPAIVPVRSDDRRLTIATAGVTIVRGVFITALIAIAGQIVKDVVLIGAVLCLLGVLDLSRNSPNDGKWLAWKTAPVFLIFAMRPTNFLMFAVAGTICALFVFGTGRKFLGALIPILMVCAAAIPLTRYINQNVLGARATTVEDSLIIFDTAGISNGLRQNLFAQLPGWPADKVRPPWECYKPERWDDFKWGKCKEYTVLFDKAMTQPGAPKSEVRWWLGIILRHPVSYVTHRIAYTFALLRGERTIVGWRLPYASNTPKEHNMISGAVDGGRDKGGGTHGINMMQQIQMWKPRLAYTPFGWVAARIFARTSSAWWGLFFVLPRFSGIGAISACIGNSISQRSPQAQSAWEIL